MLLLVRVMVFLHGTTIMHAAGVDQRREVRVRQSKEHDPSVTDYSSYVPIGHAAEKLETWASRGAEIVYLSSHRDSLDVVADRVVLDRWAFPPGDILWRGESESYADVVARAAPDVLIEDDCESIGGREEIASAHLSPEVAKKVRSVVIREFEGIDHLPDDLRNLVTFTGT
jgi:hypothetical protein